MTPETCPNCGADLPRRARVCPDCGADERTGWSEAAAVDRLDLPSSGEDFDHDSFVAREFGSGRDREAGTRRRWWWWVALGLLGAAVAAWAFF